MVECTLPLYRLFERGVAEQRGGSLTTVADFERNLTFGTGTWMEPPSV